MIPALTFSVLENFVGLACEHATRSTMVLIMRKTVWQTWQVPFVPSIVIGNQIPGPPASLCVTDTNAYSGERGGGRVFFLFCCIESIRGCARTDKSRHMIQKWHNQHKRKKQNSTQTGNHTTQRTITRPQQQPNAPPPPPTTTTTSNQNRLNHITFVQFIPHHAIPQTQDHNQHGHYYIGTTNTISTRTRC